MTDDDVMTCPDCGDLSAVLVECGGELVLICTARPIPFALNDD